MLTALWILLWVFITLLGLVVLFLAGIGAWFLYFILTGFGP